MNKPIKKRPHNYILFLSLVAVSGCISNMQENTGQGLAKKLTFDPTLQLNFHPNIIWLVTPDLGTMIRPYGDSTIETPNLDKLASEGVRYTNYYSVSGEEAPSQFALITGMYPTAAGADNVPINSPDHKPYLDAPEPYAVVPPENVKMISQVLRENGYFCTNNHLENFQFRSPVTAWDESGVNAHWKNRNKGQPFFSVFSFEVTSKDHVSNPYLRSDLRYDDPAFPDLDLNKYINNKIAETDDWKLLVSDSIEVPVPPYLPVTPVVKNDLRRVYSNILSMDRQLGILIHQLEEDGQMDSTIIMWFSTNGGPMPRQLGTLYDGGIHLPLIIRFPNHAGGGEYDDNLVSIVDFIPALYSISGIKIPEYLEGQAFLGQQKADNPRNFVYAGSDRIGSHVDMIRVVRDKQYKYFNNYDPEKPYFFTDNSEVNMASFQELMRLSKADSLNSFQAQFFRAEKPEEEFFDTSNDPFELKNIAGDSSVKKTLSKFRNACDEWLNHTGDMGLTPELTTIRMFWPGGIQPKTDEITYSINNDEVVLSCRTPAADIGYQVLSVDSFPQDRWNIYSKPVKIKANTRIIAIAQRIGFAPGEKLILEFR